MVRVLGVEWFWYVLEGHLRRRYPSMMTGILVGRESVSRGFSWPKHWPQNPTSTLSACRWGLWNLNYNSYPTRTALWLITAPALTEGDIRHITQWIPVEQGNYVFPLRMTSFPQAEYEEHVGKIAKSIYVLTKLTAMMCTYYAQDCSVYEWIRWNKLLNLW